MTQPRKPSGPGEWRAGDWLLAAAGPGLVEPVRFLEHGSLKNWVVLTAPNGDRTATVVGLLKWLARPVENDPEGWVAHHGGPNPASGMRVELHPGGQSFPSDECDWSKNGLWRPSTEPTSSPAPEAVGVESFQARVLPWLMECFGAEIAGDIEERCDRFIEEALELVQSLNWPRERATALIEYVYGRPAGEPHQEAGGGMVTFAALCQAAGLDMVRAGEDELARIMRPEIVQKIRAKQAAKPTGSALPIVTSPEPVSKSPENEQGDGLEVADDQLPFDMALKLLSDATDMAVYAGCGSANVAWTCRAAATALEAANRRIAELEGRVNGWETSLLMIFREANKEKPDIQRIERLSDQALSVLQQGVKP